MLVALVVVQVQQRTFLTDDVRCLLFINLIKPLR